MPDQAVGIHDRIRMVNGTMGAPEAVVFFFFWKGENGWGVVVILPETKQFAPEKMEGWEILLSYWDDLFSGANG